jgi:glycosyltransferase involved in cell wall biosynthesis
MLVQILLSTYNGEKYLRPLLDSVLAQDYPGIEFLVRDDGSCDGTMAILQEYAAAHPTMTIVAGVHVGIADSFFHLLERASSNAAYLALCDQDDVWQKDKVSTAVEWLQRGSPEIPALYNSRVTITDEYLHAVRVSDLPRKGLSFRNALVESVVWGCTSVINQAARGLLLRGFPRHAWVHDGWIYLVVSAFGAVLFDEEARMLHRRHKTNASLIPLTSSRRWSVQLNLFLAVGGQRRVFTQAEEFKRIYGTALSNEHTLTLDRFLRCRKSVWDRLRYAVTGDVYHQSRLGHVMLRALIALDRLY